MVTFVSFYTEIIQSKPQMSAWCLTEPANTPIFENTNARFSLHFMAQLAEAPPAVLDFN